MKNYYKKLTLFIPFLILTLSVYSQSLGWAHKTGNANSEKVQSMTIDKWGNVYTLGNFSQGIDFDPGVGLQYNVSISNDAFITKFDSKGNFIWVKTMGGTSSSTVGESITVDSAGNVYSTGWFTKTVDFDPGSGVSALTAAGGNYSDIFVQKLDSGGNFVWAKRMGSTGYDKAMSLEVDKSGNVYSTGYFNDSVDFDPGSGIHILVASAGQNSYIQKLDSNGNFVWAHNFGGLNIMKPFGLALDKHGNIHTTGYFYGTVDFNPGTGVSNLVSNGRNDIYIQKLNPSGNFLWAKNMGSSSWDEGFTIMVDNIGNVITAGIFDGTVDFNPGSGVSILTTSGVNDIFVQKLDSLGNFLWAKKIGGTVFEAPYSVRTDKNNNIYVTGSFSGTVDFDPNSGVNNLTSNGYADIFIQKLTSTGNYEWAFNFGGVNNDLGEDIFLDKKGNVYAAGTFKGTADFDPGSGLKNLTSTGGSYFYEIYNLKLFQCSDVSVTINYPIITSNAVTGATYQWMYCDSIIIPGATSKNYTVTTNGKYAVIVTQNGCTDTSTCYLMSNVGIYSHDLSDNIKMFPNPTSNIINIILSDITEKLNLNVMDNLGRNVYSTTLELANNSINIDHLPKGVYYFKFYSDKGSRSIGKRVVKK